MAKFKGIDVSAWQGEIDWELVSKFANIPNSKVVHLCYNKQGVKKFGN